MRGGPSKQPTPATNKGGPPARTTPAANTTTQAPRTNDPRHIPR
jgi:hypothetical protein